MSPMPEPGGPPTSSELVFYQGEDGRSRIQVRLEGGTVWLTQATIRKFRIVQTGGARLVAWLVDHDNRGPTKPTKGRRS